MNSINLKRMSNYLLELSTQNNLALAALIILGLAFLLIFVKYEPEDEYHEIIWYDEAKEIKLEERFEEEDVYE